MTAVTFAVLCLTPLVTDNYSQYIANLILVYVVIAIGLNFILGFAGMFAFAHAAFMGIGAYTSALLEAKLGVSYFIALPAAGIFTGLVGCLVGIPAIRVSGLYLAMVTVAFTELVHWILNNWKPVTNGADGVTIPAPSLFGWEFRGETSSFYLILVVAFAMTMWARRILQSKIGRAFVALRENETAAPCSGINVARTKTIAFGLSAFYAGIGGALFTITQHYVAPDSFGLFQTSNKPWSARASASSSSARFRRCRRSATAHFSFYSSCSHLAALQACCRA